MHFFKKYKFIIHSIIIIHSNFAWSQEKVEMVNQSGLVREVDLTEFSPDGNTILAIGKNKGVIYDLKSGLARAEFFASSDIRSICFNKDSVFFIGLVSGKIEKRSIIDGSLISEYELSNGVVNALSVSNNNHHQLLVGCDKLISFNTTTGEKTKISSKKIISIKSNSSNTAYCIIEVGDVIKAKIIDNSFKISYEYDLYSPKFKKNVIVKTAQQKAENFYCDYFLDDKVIFVSEEKIKIVDIKSGQTLFKESSYYLQEYFTAITVNETLGLAFVASQNQSIYVYDVKKLKFIKLIKTDHLARINYLSSSKNGLYFVSASNDFSLIVWDAKNFQSLLRLFSKSFPLTQVKVYELGSKLNVTNSAGMFLDIDLKNESIYIDNIMLSDHGIVDFYATQEQTQIYYLTDNNQAGLYDRVNKKNSLISKNYPAEIYKHQNTVSFLKSGKLYFSDGEKIKIEKLSKKAEKKITHFYISQDKIRVLLVTNTSDVSTQINNWNLTSESNKIEYSELNKNSKKAYYEPKFTLIESHKPIQSVKWISLTEFLFLTDNSLIYYDVNKRTRDTLYKNIDYFQYNDQNNSLFVYTEKLLCISQYPHLKNQEKCIEVGSGVLSVDYFDMKAVVVAYRNGSLKLWDINTNKMMCNVIAIDKSSMILLDQDGHYMSINNGINGIGFRIDDRIYPPEQFDLKYNRPDLILSNLNFQDTNLISAYYNAHLKRITKMGFTENMLKTDFQIPTIRITNKEKIPISTSNDQISIELFVHDSIYNLDRINVWINNVSIFGSAGYNIRNINVKSHSLTLNIPLAQGINKIQVSVLNGAGAESFKENVIVDCKKPINKPNLFLITIGASKFENEKYNLDYAAKDAQDINTIFKKNKVCDRVFTKVLLNEAVVKDSIVALRDFLAPAQIDDQVIIFIAGHGVLDNNFDYFFASYNMVFENPALNGIPYQMLEALLDGIRPLKKLLLMDTCHSGEVDKDEINVVSDVENFEANITFRNAGNTIENKLGLKSTSELVKTLFTDLRKGTGATVISSAGGVEFAMESDQWQNGLFTYCLLYGIQSKSADLNKDGVIAVSELQMYVQQEVFRLSKGKQKPTSRIVNQTLDWVVW